MLIDIHPALNISTLINNLKSASSKRLRRRFAEHIKEFYRKPVFWHRAYYVGSVGDVSLEVVRNYVGRQGAPDRPRKRSNQSA